MSTPGKAVVAVLLASIVGIILLTPLGFETRPVSGLKPIGQPLLALVFLTFFSDIAAVAVARSRPVWTARLAGVGPLLFIPPVIADQSGNFSNFTPPHAITIIELAVSVMEVLAGILALWLWSSSKAVAPPVTPR